MGVFNKEMWYQPELFNWNDPNVFIKNKKKRKVVDYEKLYEVLSQGPITFKKIQEVAGVSKNSVAQIITTLSLRYPLYEVKRGVYKLYSDEEYGDGIKRSLLQNDESDL